MTTPSSATFPIPSPLLDPDLSLAEFTQALHQLSESRPAPTLGDQIGSLTAILDHFLQGRWTEETQPGKQQATLDALKALLGPRGQGHMAMVQLNPTPGDLAGNAQKIMAALQLGETLALDLVIFPELALMGYPIRDVITRHPFLGEESLKWLEAIAQRTGKTWALVGFVEPRRQAPPGTQGSGKPFYNAMAILGDGKIQGIVRKSLLPNYGEFNDNRTFEPAPSVGIWPPETLGMALSKETSPNSEENTLLTLHGRRYALSICEDTWSDPTFFNRPLYTENPMAELAAHRPDAFINISASPTRSRKEPLKHRMLSHIAAEYRIPYVYVNQVGSIDEVSFDGASRVYDETGNLIARAAAFQEQFIIINPFQKIGTIIPLPLGLGQTFDAPKVFDAYDASDLGRTYEVLLQGIRDYFRKTGFQRAVLGLSGGIDSAVVVTLLVDALGPQNVIGLSLPSAITPSENETDAEQLAENLGIPLIRIPISDATHAFESGLEGARSALDAAWGSAPAGTITKENVQARSRAVWLWMVGNEYGAFPIATSDKSELYLGYATVHGDLAGSLAPLGDVPKTKVRLLAHWLNEHRPQQNAIPWSVIDRPSGADLAVDPATGRTIQAEEALMPYEFADEVIWRLEALGQSKAQMLTEAFQWEQRHPLSPAQKQAWLEKFFSRMAASVFKWWIAPPVLMVEGNGSITKTDYHHPITAKNIQWQGHSSTEIEQILASFSHAQIL